MPGYVLIVEDDLDTSDALLQALADAGYRAEAVRRIGEARAYVEREPPAVVLVDGFSGQTALAAFASWLRQFTAEAPVPIILMTTTAPAASPEPANLVIAKPFDMSHLLRAIEWVLAPEPSSNAGR